LGKHVQMQKYRKDRNRQKHDKRKGNHHFRLESSIG